ncbi:alpha/beta fold hydrolase [Leucobacter sp. HY1908]
MSDTAQHLTVEVLGAPTKAWQYGSAEGPALIMVHGFRGDHHGLEGIARSLAAARPELRIIVPDLPGFGASPAIGGRTHDIALYGEWLRAFAAATAPTGFAILGHSFGSLVVTAAIKGGLDPVRAILINPISAPALEGPQALLTQLAIGYYKLAEMLPERGARALLGNPAIVRGMSEVMAKTRDRELRAWIHGQHGAYFSRFADAATLLDAFRASVSHTVIEDARVYTMPTLIVAGDRDDITPLAKQLELQRRIPEATLRIIPGTGHLVHYEAVEDAVAFVIWHLTEEVTA